MVVTTPANIMPPSTCKNNKAYQTHRDLDLFTLKFVALIPAEKSISGESLVKFIN